MARHRAQKGGRKERVDRKEAADWTFTGLCAKNSSVAVSPSGNIHGQLASGGRAGWNAVVPGGWGGIRFVLSSLGLQRLCFFLDSVVFFKLVFVPSS
jgi:hypothetical protein